MKIRGTWLLAGALLLTAGARGAAADIQKVLDQSMRSVLKDQPGVGVVVGVITPERTHVYAFGERGPDDKRPPDGQTIYEIGSITKVFTTLVLAEMVREKTVKLEDPVQSCLPEEFKVPRRGERNITLLDLATHTSGLPRLPPELDPDAKEYERPKDEKNLYADFDVKKLMRSLGRLKLERDVGAKYEYSNLGVGLLGHALVHKAKAKSYEELVVKRVCDPLGMKDTRITLSSAQRARLAKGHGENGKPTPNWDFGSMEGCGALRSSADDMLRFLAAALGLKKTPLLPSFEACHAARHDTDEKDTRIGLGWHLTPGAGTKTVCWHNGGTGGYHSFLGLNKETGTGVVILMNSARRGDALDGIGMLILPLLEPKPPAKD